MNSSLLITEVLALSLMVAVALAPALYHYLQQRRR
ncbi:hypothetical protein J2X32_000511 [Rheinheimera pacifica]|jgi:hypothetical protein|nr:hypothetical protein [Rheinheimera pacifica]